MDNYKPKEWVQLMGINKSKFEDDQYYASISEDDMKALFEAVNSGQIKKTQYGYELKGWVNTNSKTGAKFISLKWEKIASEKPNPASGPDATIELAQDVPF
jgi:hypothetical protein